MKHHNHLTLPHHVKETSEKLFFLIKAIFNRTIIAHHLTLLYTISLLNL